jgi:hypothetical protein
MHKTLLTFFLALTALTLRAQTLASVETINTGDTGPLTAGVVDAAGNLYVASLANTQNFGGQVGIFSWHRVGVPVISKFSPDGALLWRREFPGNRARVFAMVAAPGGDGIVLTGGYIDTLQGFGFAALPADSFNSSFFLTRLDGAGNPLWLSTSVGEWFQDQFGVALELHDNSAYVIGVHSGVDMALREHDLTDGALLREKVFEGIRTFSDLAVDDAGNVFIVGSTSPLSPVDSLVVPMPGDTWAGYANFLMRLDADWQAQWIRTTRYETFDFHHRLELFNGQIFTLSNDFGEANLDNGAVHLRAYTPGGEPTWSKVILENAWWNDAVNFALKAACDRLVLQHPVVYGFNDIGLELRAFDAALNDTVLVTTTDGDFSENTMPFFAAGAGRLVFGGNFSKAAFAVNGVDMALNPAQSQYAQLLLEFECAAASGIAEAAEASANWRVTPNPVGDVLYLMAVEAASEPTAVELYDAHGRHVARFATDGAAAEWPVSGMAPGVYFLKASTRGKTEVLRWIKR